jgi:hydrogenase nickel incorporation protein HypA/HybF
MHELALARSLTEIVDEYAAEHGVTHVKKINVRLGEMSAMTRALHFCFDSVSEGTSCEGAILNIEIIPLTVYCGTCDAVKAPTGRYSFRCPDCGMPAHKVITGREMQLASFEHYETDEALYASPIVQQSSALERPGRT